MRKLVLDYAMFPTPSQFIAADERRLYDHVMLRGGGPVWAARLGVLYSQGNRRQCLLWTEDRVRTELGTFLAGWDRWPTVAEFTHGGKEQLRRALIRLGGMHRWAEEFVLSVGNFRGPHRAWTEDRIEAAVRDLIRGRGEWPRQREFCAAGLAGCYAAIWRTGGAAHWAPKLGLDVVVHSAAAQVRGGVTDPPTAQP